MAERGYIGGTTFEPTVDVGYIGGLSYTTTASSGGGNEFNPAVPSKLAFPVRAPGRAFPTHQYRAFPHE